MKKIYIFLALFMLVHIFYSTTVLINSQDWRDVYTGIMYGKHINASKILFFIDSSQYASMHYRLSKNQEIIIFESADNPYVDNYASVLRSKGFDNITVVNITSPEMLSFNLAKELKAKKFILVPDEVGYPCISVAPYALATNSWVLFVNTKNVNDTISFLSDINPGHGILYGQVQEKVEDALKSFTTERINKGSRFDNNLEIIKKMHQSNPSNQQITLTNGEFLEMSLFNNKYPTILIGRERTPTSVINYLNNANFTIGTLIGQELFDVAKKIKETTKLEHIYIKYGEALVGYNDKGEMIKTLKDLDKFYLPVYDLRLNVENARYNLFDRTLYVTYHNVGNSTVFFKSNIVVKGAETNEMMTVSDVSAHRINPHEYYYAKYKVDLRDLMKKFDRLSLDLTALYGEDYNALNLVLNKNITKLEIFKFNDESNISIGNVYYVYDDKKFYVEVENKWNDTTYAKIYLTYTLNGINRTLSSDEIELSGGQTMNVTFHEVLTRDTVEALDGTPVVVSGNYGGIKDFLPFSVNEKRLLIAILPMDYLWILLLILLLILIAYIIYKKWKEKERGRGHSRSGRGVYRRR